ncbi:hypothetical protein Tco_0790077 [Tanacetum coccineum]
MAIQELVAEATRPLPVVEGKGKAIATDKQAAQSLLALHTPKRRSTIDQFIFQRRTSTNEEASTGPSAQPQDDTSANIVRDSSSPTDAKTGADTDMTNSGGDTKILQIDEEQGGDVANMDEDQAGTDPGKSRVALAGANPEPTHEDFMANVYPQQAPSSSSKKQSAPHSEQPVDDVPIPDDVNILDSEDTDTAHLPKIQSRPDRIGKKKLSKSDLEAPAFKVSKAFHENSISLQFQMEECYRMLTDQVDLVNPEGHRLVPDVSKLLPVGGPPGQVTIQSQYFFNKDLEYLVSSDKGRRSALSISKLKAAQYLDFRLEELVPSLWIESEHEYDISAAYGISHWWFKLKEFYITRHSAPSDRSAIVLRRNDYKEYKILEADFKNLHPNDFEDLYLLHLQGQLNHLSGANKLGIESYQTKLNLTQPDWDASDFLFKEDYTKVSEPRAVIYKDINDQKKMMRETDVHRFSDGILQRILDKLNHIVKDFKLYEYNPGMETRIWSENDRRRSKEFMEVIERRIKI